MTIYNTPEGIAFYRLCALRSALRLEVMGMQKRGRSAYSICKEEHNLKGNKQKVLTQMNTIVQEAKDKLTHKVGQ